MSKVQVKPGGNRLLSEATRSALEAKGWSLRRAERETGVPFYTINQMVEGETPTAVDRIMILALKTASKESRFETMLHWLHLAGQSELVAMIRQAVEPDSYRVTPLPTLMATGDKYEIIEHSREPVLIEMNEANIAAFAAVGRAIQSGR